MLIIGFFIRSVIMSWVYCADVWLRAGKFIRIMNGISGFRCGHDIIKQVAHDHVMQGKEAGNYVQEKPKVFVLIEARNHREKTQHFRGIRYYKCIMSVCCDN